MKPAPLGALNADLAPIEEDLAARIDAISTLPQHSASPGLHGAAESFAPSRSSAS
jgi:hypothetical protein